MIKAKRQITLFTMIIMSILIIQACDTQSSSKQNGAMPLLGEDNDSQDQGLPIPPRDESDSDDLVDLSIDEMASYQTAPCLVSTAGPTLPNHRSESDETYLDRLASLQINNVPSSYDLSGLDSFALSLIKYMLDEPDLTELTIEKLITYGIMGRAVLMALANPDRSNYVDIRELRRGLYHFYNCSRKFPATLSIFKSIYGDFDAWESTMYEDSFPKIHPRRLRHDRENGIYIAETLRNGQVYETEILLSGYRNDGNLDFISYAPNGQISSTGEFRAESSFTVGASPYTCLTCHASDGGRSYDVIFPDLRLPTADPDSTTDPNDDSLTDPNDDPDNPVTDPNDDPVTDPNDGPNDDSGGSNDNQDNMISESECGLRFWAEVKDQQGPCTVCRNGDYITLVAVLSNTCAETTKVYESNQNCIVSEFEVYNQISASSAAYPMTCRDSSFRVELMPGERYEETRPAGRLSSSNYSLTIQLENPERNRLSIDFSVE